MSLRIWGVLRLSHNAVSLRLHREAFPKGSCSTGTRNSSSACQPRQSEHPNRWHIQYVCGFIAESPVLLRLKPHSSSARLQFPIKWYAPNEKYRVAARWIPYAPTKIERSLRSSELRSRCLYREWLNL